MICFPNAKINLGLHVVSKRMDGYHNIETVFYPVPLQDALEIIAADSFSFSLSGISIHGDQEQNLVVKALRLIEKEYDIPPLEVHLLKAIPYGAGLGGGSSDAAFMLKLLNDFRKLNLSIEQLEEKASVLGADCPFFIQNRPVFASGTGNIFEPVSLSLQAYHICIVKPDILISTQEAYRMIKPEAPAISLLEIIKKPVFQWRDLMINDFEKSIFSAYPEIKKIKERFYEAGAVYASMSGSGSSVFGLFVEPVSLKADYPDCFVWEGKLF